MGLGGDPRWFHGHQAGDPLLRYIESKQVESPTATFRRLFLSPSAHLMGGGDALLRPAELHFMRGLIFENHSTSTSGQIPVIDPPGRGPRCPPRELIRCLVLPTCLLAPPPSPSHQGLCRAFHLRQLRRPQLRVFFLERRML
eukprot:4642140-Pyramimonas_sp.AAC.1